MKILFYVDPIIEMGRPYFKENWANNYCANIVSTLRRSINNSVEFTYIFNEPIAMKFNNSMNAKIITLTQEEIYKPFPKGYNYLDITMSWYKCTYSEDQLQYYVELLKLKITDEPDIVITFSPVPFIKKAFPMALILHHEYGMFSREPYPKTWYFDVEGMNGSAYLTKYWSMIEKKFHISLFDEQKIIHFKDVCKKLINDKTPFKNAMLKLKKRFDHLVLLPLQFSQYYLFDSVTTFKSQYDYLISVLDNVPSNIGVLVTTHPDYDILNDELLDYCRLKYPNFIYDKEFEKYYASSQYLISDVDAVITVSSSIGLQTLLWDNKLISLGDGFLNFIADSKSLDNVKDILEEPKKNKNKVLFWIITRYAIQNCYASDPDWLFSFLRSCLKKYRSGSDNINFYDLIDDDVERIFSNFINSLNYNVPIPAVPFFYSVERLKLLKNDRLNKMISNQNAQLFIDTGSGFCEETSIIVKINSSEIVLEFALNDFTGIKALRVDPVCMPAFIKFNSISLHHDKGTEVLEIINSNADYQSGDKFWFFTDDPQVYLAKVEVGRANMLTVNFEFSELPIGLEIDEFVKRYRVIREELENQQIVIQKRDKAISTRDVEIQDKNRTISTKDMEIQDKSRTISTKDMEIEDKNKTIIIKDKEIEDQKVAITHKDDQIKDIQFELEELKKEYKMLTNSTSWKITKPLRYIVNKIRKVLNNVR